MKKLWAIRKDHEAVSPVIATILMVAITVVLAAVLYVMVSGLLGGGSTTRPYITFGAVTPGGSGTNLTEYWTIADSNPPNAYSAYKIQVLKDGNPLAATAQTITQNIWITFGTIKVKVTDVGGEGKLTGGDRFDVVGMTTGSTYVLSLIWAADGAELQTKTWTI
jgi:flagellin-like protein